MTASARGFDRDGNGREFRNLLLTLMPADEQERLAALLEPVRLKRRDVLCDPERPIEHVCFIETGIASILSVMGDGSGVETGTIGAEGLIGLPVFHGMDRSAEQVMMQVPGDGHRIAAAAFRELLPELPRLSELLHRYSVYLFTFAAQNSGCNRKHSIEERCAKWLLTVHDRMPVDEFQLTHDFVSQMLGVRRASVTVTLGAFERAGMIRNMRSQIAIVDRPGLESAACECYEVIRASLERTFGGPGESVLARLRVSADGHSTVAEPKG